MTTFPRYVVNLASIGASGLSAYSIGAGAGLDSDIDGDLELARLIQANSQRLAEGIRRLQGLGGGGNPAR